MSDLKAWLETTKRPKKQGCKTCENAEWVKVIREFLAEPRDIPLSWFHSEFLKKKLGYTLALRALKEHIKHG